MPSFFQLVESSDAFFRSMMKKPDERLTWGAWADWLDDNQTDPELAAVLRANAELHDNPAADNGFADMIAAAWKTALQELADTGKATLIFRPRPGTELFPAFWFEYAKSRNRINVRRDRVEWTRVGREGFGARRSMKATPAILKKNFRDIYPAVRKLIVLGMLYVDGMPIVYANRHAPGDTTILEKRHRVYELITTLEKIIYDLELGVEDQNYYIDYVDLHQRIMVWFAEFYSPGHSAKERRDEVQVFRPVFDRLSRLLQQLAERTGNQDFNNLRLSIADHLENIPE